MNYFIKFAAIFKDTTLLYHQNRKSSAKQLASLFLSGDFLVVICRSPLFSFDSRGVITSVLIGFILNTIQFVSGMICLVCGNKKCYIDDMLKLSRLISVIFVTSLGFNFISLFFLIKIYEYFHLTNPWIVAIGYSFLSVGVYYIYSTKVHQASSKIRLLIFATVLMLINSVLFKLFILDEDVSSYISLNIKYLIPLFN